MKIKWFWITYALASCAIANPYVERIDIISSTRIDRTNYQYVLRPVIRGSDIAYTDVSIALSSKSSATKVLSGPMFLGVVEPSSTNLPTGGLVIQHDRTYPFDMAALVPQIQGNRKSSTAVNGAAGFGSVKYYEVAGRPGHEGLMPYLQETPQAGRSLALMAQVYGAPTAVSYEFISTNGRLIAQGALLPGPTPNTFGAQILIPAEPYSQRITASMPAGANSEWTSGRTIVPGNGDVELEFEKSFIYKSELAKLKIALNVPAGDYDVRVFPPPILTTAYPLAYSTSLPSQTGRLAYVFAAAQGLQGINYGTVTVEIVNRATRQKLTKSARIRVNSI